MGEDKADPFDVDALRIESPDPEPDKRSGPPHRRPGEPFLRGPVPWDWITAAAPLPHRALNAAPSLSKLR
jgi:hypothetical protein